MHYYGTRLSENLSRREPEGYLLCLNVPVARTGMQEYLPAELGMAGSAPVPVYRPEEEVFSEATIASFEGMPVTNDHPPEGVDVFNIRALQKGHAHNVRRGSGEESDLLLADLIITDPALITAILGDGKREISCGYTYELCEENGQYIQRKIRGNHVAVVDAGRAGSRVSIKDHKPERRNTHMKKSLSKVLARMAKDGDIETVAEFIEEMIEPEAAVEETAEKIVEAVGVTVEEPAAEAIETEEENTVAEDEATLADIVSRLDQIIALLTPVPAADEDLVEEIAEAVEEAIEAAEAAEEMPEETPGAEEIAAIVEELVDPEASVVLEPEEGTEDECGEGEEQETAGDTLRAVLATMRPALAQMPRRQRRKIAGDIAVKLRKNGKCAADGRAYRGLAAASRRVHSTAGPDLGRKIMASRNPNYKH